jgi:hypothetical protein
MSAIKIIFSRMGTDKETEATMHPAAKNRTMNRLAIPRHKEIPIGFMESPNMVVAHTVIHGQNQFNAMTAKL